MASAGECFLDAPAPALRWVEYADAKPVSVEAALRILTLDADDRTRIKLRAYGIDFPDPVCVQDGSSAVYITPTGFAVPVTVLLTQALVVKGQQVENQDGNKYVAPNEATVTFVTDEGRRFSSVPATFVVPLECVTNSLDRIKDKPYTVRLTERQVYLTHIKTSVVPL